MSGSMACDRERTEERVLGLDLVVIVAGNLTPDCPNSQTLLTFGANFGVVLKNVLVGLADKSLGGFMVVENMDCRR